MTIEQMNQRMEDIRTLESELSRKLTAEEQNLILEKGYEYFIINCLKITLEDWELYLKAKSYLLAYTLNNPSDLLRARNESDNGCKRIFAYMYHLYFPDVKCTEDNSTKEDVIERYKNICTQTQRFKQANSEFKEIDIEDDINKIDSFQVAVNNVTNALSPDWKRYIDKVNQSIIQEAIAIEHPDTDEIESVIIDSIKDQIVNGLCEELINNKGKVYVIPKEVRGEIVEKLWCGNDNISICSVNDKITVK